MSASLANLGIEKAVLGSLINGGRSLIDVLGVAAIDPNLFYHSQPLKILGAIAELYEEGAPYDLQVVTERLRQHGTLEDVGGAAEITSLGIDGNPAPEVVRFNLGMLRDLEVKRRIARVGERMQRGQIEIEEPCETLNEIRTRTYDHAKPLIEFRSPLELKNFTPPPGLVLSGDCHIVKGSVFVVGGAPGIGKSRASVGLAVAGATGDDWFGLRVHRRFKTMIIQTENGLFRLSKEFRGLDCDVLENYIRICPPPPFGLCLGREDFRMQLATKIRNFGPDLIVLDPWNAAARDEKAHEYLETFELIRSLLPAGDDSPTIGIIAHTRKPRADERATGRGLLNLLAGSYVLGSVPRTVVIMQAASDDTTDNRIVWTCCKNNDGELGARSAWERRNGLFAQVHDFDWDTLDNAHSDDRVTITADDMVEVLIVGRSD